MEQYYLYNLKRMFNKELNHIDYKTMYSDHTEMKGEDNEKFSCAKF